MNRMKTPQRPGWAVLRVAAGLCGLLLMAVPLLIPTGWEPMLAILPATGCLGFAVFGED